MRSIIFFFFLTFFVQTKGTSVETSLDKYVTISLMGQFGNQLFQIATAYAYALDQDLPLTVPDLKNNKEYNVPFNAEKVFNAKVASYDLPSSPLVRWEELPSKEYCIIPKSSKIELYGYFQNEKYFKHRRAEILELFKMPSVIREKVLREYPILNTDALVVGVQIRDYRFEQPNEMYHPTKKRDYFEKAVSFFPKDAIFLVSTNNLKLAKECMEGLDLNIIFLQNDYIEEFYILSLCKSHIISNSSFGWWAAWLCEAKNKVVVAPKQWFSWPFNNEEMSRGLFVNEWIFLDY